MDTDQKAITQLPKAFLEDKIVRRAASIGATTTIVVGTIRALLELYYSGFNYPVALISASLAVVAGFGYHYLSWRGSTEKAVLVFIWGIWALSMADAVFQNGIATPVLALLPVLLLSILWVTGDKKSLFVMLTLSLALLGFAEVAAFLGLFEPEGVSSPLIGFLIIAATLAYGSFLTLYLFDYYMHRFNDQQELAYRAALSESNYRGIVESSVDPIYRADEQGRIVTISPSIEAISGYTPLDLMGQNLSDFYADPTRREEFVALLQADGEVKDFEAELVSKDGSPFWVSTHAHIWRDEEGKILGVEGIIRDITEWRDVQQRLTRAQKLEVVDQLTVGMAHDFNNLLGIMLGGAELIKIKAVDDDALTQTADVIAQAAGRASELTQKMVAFTGLESTAVSAVDVNDSLLNLESMLRSYLTAGVTVEFDLAPDLWLAQTLQGELQDAIVNLAVNSRDSMKGAGALQISTRNQSLSNVDKRQNPDFEAGDYVRIDVIDTGSGIPASIQERVFEPFFTTKSRDLGTGLGLSMVYGFVRRCAGDVSITSEEGKGTKVSVYLPRCTDESAQLEQKTLVSLDEVKHGDCQHILLVEDEPALATLNKTRLETIGYRVTVLESGIEAKAYLESDQPATDAIDLLLTDVVMPGGISGIDLVEITRQNFADIKLLICSGLTEADALLQAEQDLPDVLRKPFTTAEMASAVHRALN